MFLSSNMLVDDSLEIAVATGLAIVGLVSVPAVSSLALQLTTREPKQDTYEDNDGKATPESVNAYSAKWPKTFVLLFALLSSGTSIATSVLTSLQSGSNGLFLENWLSTGASVSCRSHNPTMSHNSLESNPATLASYPVAGSCNCLK